MASLSPATAVMKRVGFMAHPVSGDQTANVARAIRWLRWLIATYPHYAFEASWIAYVLALDDDNPVDRQRGLEDSRALVSRCDTIFLVGGRLTVGMAGELNVAQTHGRELCDLLYLGEEPPL